MDTPFKSYMVQWQIGDRHITNQSMNASYPTEDIYWCEYPIPAPVGYGGFRSIKLSNGISLHHSTFHFDQQSPESEWPSVRVHMVFNEPTLMVKIVVCGAVTQRDELSGNITRLAPGFAMIKCTEEWQSILSFDRTPVLEMLYLQVTLSALQALIGPTLCEKLLKVATSTSDNQKIPVTVTNPLRYCFDYELKGSLHKLHAQAKTLEFLENLIRFTDGEIKRPAVARNLRAQAAHDLIKQLGVNLPSVSSLASRLGVSTKTLNTAFIETYGMSIAQFLKEQRLAIAHEQLLSSTKSIKEICNLLGYSQISNFSTTFKSFYGYSPTALRQRAGTGSD